MTADLKRDRSPNYPKMSLADAIELTKRLYKQAGKAKISRVAAVGPLGYTGIHGASLTTLGALSAYGLVDVDRGEGVSVSALAVRLIHPVGPAQEAEAKRESALRPKVFAELYSEDYHRCTQEVIANHLVQK